MIGDDVHGLAKSTEKIAARADNAARKKRRRGRAGGDTESEAMEVEHAKSKRARTLANE